MFPTPLLHVSKLVGALFQRNLVIDLLKSVHFCLSFAYYFFSISKILASRFLVNLQDKCSIWRHYKNKVFILTTNKTKKSKFILLKNSLLSLYSL